MGGVLALGAALVAPQLNAQEKVPLTSGQAVEMPRTVAPSMVRVPMEAKIVKDAPYSADVVNESTQTLADGNRIVRKSTGRVYRDSQGRTRREDEREPGRPGIVSVSDPVAGISFSLDPEAKIAWKTPFNTAGNIVARMPPPPPPPPMPADPADLERKRTVDSAMAQQSGGRGGGRGGARATTAPLMKTELGHYDQKTEKLPQRMIEGVMADGTRVTRTIPAGAIGNEAPIVTITEEWRSPELQILVLTRTTDPRTGESTYKLLNIDRSEPNQSWFEVPADYTVRESGIYRLDVRKK
jgi:hypothetical protein